MHWITDNVNIDSDGSVSSIKNFLRLLRLFKLFRILRLVKLAPKLFAILESSVKLDPAFLRFVRSIISLIFMWHLMGTLRAREGCCCAWAAPRSSPMHHACA